MKNYFLIQSSGRTATQWINQLLNFHDDIFCSHGFDLNPNLKDSNPRFLQIHKDTDKYSNLGVDCYFDKLEQYSDKNIVGNIHGGFNTVDVLSNPRMFARQYKVCFLVRHPVIRIKSFVKRWKYEISINNYIYTKYVNRFRQIRNTGRPFLTKLYDSIDFTKPDNFLFVNALIDTIALDRQVYSTKLPYYNMERLTSDIEYIVSLVLYISSGKAAITEEYLNHISSIGIVNQLSEKQFSISIFSDWEEWQQRLFKYFLMELDMEQAYNEFGYNISYLLD